VEENALHFLMLTELNWIPLVACPAKVEILLDAIRWRQVNRGWRLHGWALLEDHGRLLLQDAGLSTEVAASKSYTARRLIDYFAEQRVERILYQIAWSNKADRTFQVWDDGSHLH
jgi:REP element-mobilizing transposase RayT